MLFSKPMLVTKAVIGLAVAMSPASVLANPACALSVQGCVLPVGTPAPVVDTTVSQPVVVTDVAEPKAFPLLPLLGLALAGLAAYLILDDDEDQESP